MAEVEDARALLLLAVKDLYDAEDAMATRLPAVRANASDPELKKIIAEDEAASAAQRDTLDRIARELGEKSAAGEDNIWLRAVLDDADNDARTVAPGLLLDIALTGALRKGKQSERVSYETALALARRLQKDDAAAALSTIRDAEEACDTALASVLERLAAKA